MSESIRGGRVFGNFLDAISVVVARTSRFRHLLPALLLLSGASTVFADEPKPAIAPANALGQTPSEKAPSKAQPDDTSVQTTTDTATNATTTDGTSPPKSPPDVVEVSVFGRRDDALQKIPGSGTLVGAKEIRRAIPSDSGEVLRRVTGLHVRPEEGMGLRLNLGMRGLDPTRSRQVLVLEDGIPVSINPYGEPDLYYSTPVDRIRAIEVVKGSGSILFGPQTIGGVVNFLTTAPPDKPEWTLEAQYGQRNYLKLFGLYGGSAADGAARYVVQLSRRQGDGIRGIGFGATDFLGKVAIATSEKSDATIKVAVYDEFSRSTYVGLTQSMYEQDPRAPTIALHDGFYVRRYDVSLTHEYRLSEATRIRTFIYGYITNRAWRRQNYDREELPDIGYERIVGDRSTPGGAVYFRGTATTRDRKYEVLGIEPRLEHRFSTGKVRHTLTAGVRLHGETAERLQFISKIQTSNTGDLESEEHNRTFAFAAYAQDRIAFRDDLLVTPGIRLETIDSKRRIRPAILVNSVQDIWIDGTSTNTAVMPGIGIVGGSPRLNVFGGVHIGYAPPRVSAAILANGADANLDAEQSTNFELGVRLAKPKWLRAELTGFVMNFRNQIVTGSLASGQQNELVNGGQTLHKGAESSITMGIGQALKLPLTLDLAARYTFSHATYRGGPFDGNRLPYAPLHTANVSLDAEHKIGLGAEIAWTYVSDQFSDENNTIAVDPTGRLGLLPAYNVFDVNLRYRHAKTGLGALVTVKNATDQIFVATRLPDGIQTGGFRQVNIGLRWDHK
jgi:Fe(3+) dicitrate transport protein